MQVEEESPKQYVDIARVPDKEMRPERPVPLGLRPGRSSASLPGLTISTYGLRRAPRIRSVLATTHHAPIYEIGSIQVKSMPTRPTNAPATTSAPSAIFRGNRGRRRVAGPMDTRASSFGSNSDSWHGHLSIFLSASQ